LGAWRAWLMAHHGQTESVWLVYHKKAAGGLFGYGEIVDQALCFGWIDSLPRKLDERRSMLLVSPRKPGSSWSKVNKDKVERLIREGLMAVPGLAAVAAAKADGSWERLNAVDALEVPDDLALALFSHLDAARNWAAFPVSARRGILEWILNAKTAATRAKRVAETAGLAAQNKRANQWPR
jgi:uncharacterized protein YdeI (YjbR/CyaY-like superfamily)